MIKRTVYFGNPVYLSKKDSQLVLNFPDESEADESRGNPAAKKNERYTARGNSKSIPIEDIGVVILDDPRITVSIGAIQALLENNSALITCDSKHHPSGLLLTLESNQVQSERYQKQISSSVSLKKNLWQQTVTQKIINQANLLEKQGVFAGNMKKWSASVKSGDPGNLEARASVYYWKNIFPRELNFLRHREGLPPNNLLNYGYSILRATVARGLTASGLLPTLGIHHHNKYNAYCLADDIMEPYRPYVDEVVLEMIKDKEIPEVLSPEIKKRLLSIPALTINIDNEESPLMVGIQRTTSSLFHCFEGASRKIIYPELR